MQPDRGAIAAAWLSAGARDLDVARLTATAQPSLACFHAQQAAEKALKAAAVAVCGDMERSHSLLRLIDDLRAASHEVPASILRAAQILERYYAPTRYPDAVGGLDPGELYTEDDARETYALAQTVVAFGRGVASRAELA